MRAIVAIGVLAVTGIAISDSHAAAPADKPLHNGWEERQAYAEQIRVLIRKGSFDDLERIAKELISDDSRSTAGAPKIVDFYDAMRPLADEKLPRPDFRGDGAERRMATYKAWLEAKPSSYLAKIGLSMAEFEIAWRARGDGWAKDVPPEKMRVYEEHIAASWEWAKKARAEDEHDPELYSYLIGICRDVGCARTVVDEYLASAIAMNPKYDAAYIAMANYLLPRWQGSVEEFTEFAEKSANDNKALGNMVYARIASVGLLTEGDKFPSVYPDLKWERIRSGLLEIDKYYPDSTRTYHLLARFAWVFHDKDTARMAQQRLTDHIDTDVVNFWWNPYNFQGARKWALEDPATPAKGTADVSQR
jgi:hypothetical protein